MYIVYLIRNNVNGKLYVGKSSDKIDRWKEHRRIARNGPITHGPKYSYLHGAITKYGVENFSFSILESHDLEENALDGEMAHIARLKSLNYSLYNLTDGGEGTSGYKHLPESKRKMSLSRLGKQRGPLSVEAKLKISISKKGKLPSRRTVENARQSNLGKKRSEKTKRLISASGSGERNPMAKLTWAKVDMIRDLFRRGITLTELAIQFETTQSNISLICRNKRWKIRGEL